MLRLSPAQRRMLERLQAAGEAGERTHRTGNKGSHRLASAWHRTAEVLERRGLITTVREGDARRAFITGAGRLALANTP